MTEPLIVTLELDDKSQAYFQSLRDQHFPPERNIVPAHVSLFHKLPGSELEKVASDVLSAIAPHSAFKLQVSGLQFTGKGVMFKLECNELTSIQKVLAKRWSPWLTPQDAQPFRPHIVVQNKTTPEQARLTLTELEQGFEPITVWAKQLVVWKYLNGPWKRLQNFPF